MDQWLSVYCLSAALAKDPKLSSQHPPWSAPNCLYVQLQRIQFPLLSFRALRYTSPQKCVLSLPAKLSTGKTCAVSLCPAEKDTEAPQSSGVTLCPFALWIGLPCFLCIQAMALSCRVPTDQASSVSCSVVTFGAGLHDPACSRCSLPTVGDPSLFFF